MSLMVSRIRKGSRPHVYLREWRKHLGLSAIRLAERLEIERESYYRLERNPGTLSVAEVAEIADFMGLDDPSMLWRPPPSQNEAARPSLDQIAKNATEADLAALADMTRRFLRVQ